MKQYILPFIVFLVVAAVAGYEGYLYGTLHSTQSSLTRQLAQPLTVASPNGSGTVATANSNPQALIKKQQVLVVGTLTGVSGSQISMQGDDGTSGTFSLSPTAMIFPVSTPDKPVMGTHDKSAIIPNQRAAVTLDWQGSNYLVTMITYIKNPIP